MGVRLNKVLSELNIGLQTAVEFLKKKSELGEVKDDVTTNTKISDEQYEALVDQFSTDKAVKTQAEKLFVKKPKEKKVEKVEKPEMAITKTEEMMEQRPQFKAVGKINLDEVGKPKAAPAPAKEEEPVVAAESHEEKPAVAEQPVEEKPVVVEAPQTQPSEPEEETEPEESEEEGAGESHETSSLAKTPGDFMKPATQLNVVGKIDLSTLNQSTRPKKKSKQERRKEREEKAAGERKKRERIRTDRVDIEAAAKQASKNDKKQKNNGQQQNQQQQQGGKKNKKNRNVKPLEVDDEAVARQVKETLARLTSKNQNKKGAKYRREKRDAVAERMSEEMAAEAAQSKVLKLTEFVTVSELATMMNVGVNQVIGTCMSIGIMVSINQRLDAETINIVADEFGFTTEYVSAEVQNAITEEEDDENDLISRPPIVTVMGHVDHGKTSLLDHIRNTNVIAGEAGGITQHIGAYNVKLKDGHSITFLDTPGHEAFTAMRARGAKVTDIVIVIVAADDSVMPQTVEALNHASAAGVPIIFAINKIDKPGANPEKIKEELAQMNYLVEDWGGKYQSQDISAKKGIGVSELMEKVLLEADMLDLKANPNRKATGSVIESSLDKGRGYVATVLVDNGTLHVGDIVLAGTHFGKVKAMFNERNVRITESGPSTPVLILGLDGAPTAGDKFNVMDTDQEARQIANKREQLQREQSRRTQTRVTLEDIGRRRALGDFHELNCIVKGDVDGSIEALSDSLIKLSTPEVQVNVIHKAVGAITESDVTLAAASDAYIIGFQVRPSASAKRAAEQEGVDIRIYSIIYDAIEEVKSAMEGMLSPDIKEEVIGSAEVRQVYHISKVGTIAGAMVIEGKLKRQSKVRVIRDGIVIHTGELASLKRFKDDVKEVSSGYDCGLSIKSYNDLQENDIIEAFEEIEVHKTL